MSEIKEYKKLDVWLKSRQLVKIVYEYSKKFPKDELFGLTSQIRRAAISIPSNIAEGVGRNTSRKAEHFLSIAKGSLFELETQLFLSFDLDFISIKELESILSIIEDEKKLLNGFANYYRKKLLISNP